MKVKVEGTRYETEIWKNISWQDIAITVLFWREFSLTSMKISKSVSVYEVKFPSPLQKSIFCHIYNHGNPQIILNKFWQIFFHNSATNH